MADIEMDVDVAPPFDFDGQADEDLIDYDIDTTEEHQPTATWPSHDEEQKTGGTAVDAQTDVPVGFESKLSETATEPDEAEAAQVVGDDLQDENPPDDALASHGNTSNKQSPPHDDVGVFETEQTEVYDEVDVADVTTAVEADVENEIDYEDTDDLAAEESYIEQERVGVDGDEEGLKDDQDVTENVTNSNPPSVTSQVPQNAHSQEPRVEDEITWEEGEGEGEGEGESESESDDEDDTDETSSDGSESDSEAAESTEALDHLHEEHIDSVDFGHDDTVEDHSATTAQQKMTAFPRRFFWLTEDDTFPAITVQYRGEEYPLFSSGGSEGFFSDPMVLDVPIDWLLTRFREELANELTDEDELVFRVDEIGLEFSESIPGFVLLNTTLRGIMDLFDLLVNNQDPDTPRTLYTYLFTRPQAKKRFNFLLQSAAAGKGLDEVTYLFESPMQRDASAVDENVDVEDTCTQPSAQHKDGECDVTNENQTDDVDCHDDNESMDGIDEHVKEDEAENAADMAADVEAENEAEAEAENEEAGQQDNVEEHEDERQRIETPSTDAAAESDHQTTAKEPDHSLNATETNDPVDSDSNPFLHLELDEFGDADADADALEQEDTHGLADDIDDEHASLSTANTSSTDTLVDNGETLLTHVDLHMELPSIPEIQAAALADLEELAEIDWRDGPDSTGSAEHDDAPDTPSGVLKRPRTDDEESMEEEQGVKRRRS